MRSRLRQPKPGDTPDLTIAVPIGKPSGRMSAVIRPKTIGGQLTRILALALILVLALLGVTVYRELSDYRESNDTVKAVSLALSVQDLTNQIQRELGLSNGLLGGDNRLQQPLLDQRGKVDSALGTITSAAAGDAPAPIRCARRSAS